MNFINESINRTKNTTSASMVKRDLAIFLKIKYMLGLKLDEN